MSAFRRLDRALVILRTRAGLKQMDLARRAGITPSMISEYEAGKKTPHVDTLGKILDVLGLDAHGLASALRTAQREEDEPRQRTAERDTAGSDADPIARARFRANDALGEMSDGFEALVRSIEDILLGLSDSGEPDEDEEGADEETEEEDEDDDEDPLSPTRRPKARTAPRRRVDTEEPE